MTPRIVVQEYGAPPINCFSEFHKAVNSPKGIPNTPQTGHVTVHYSGYNIYEEATADIPETITRCPADEWCRTKCIIRPLAAHVYNVHDVQVYEPGWFKTMRVDPSEAVFKHVRCKGGKTWE